MATLPLRTILIPTDFSDRLNSAFRLASTLAQHHDAQLVVLHVMEQACTPETMPVTCRLEQENAAIEILRIAEIVKPDMIVMGTRDHRGPPKTALESVVEQVIRHAPCPVLTLRGQSGRLVDNAARIP